ncbi:MAG: class I SAM-dependent methyltransferase [Candidatus Thorarchaeota archaeon]
MKRNEFKELNTQLGLPFQSTLDYFLQIIFKVLEKNFKLRSNSKQRFIDLGSGNGSVILYSALNFNIISVGIEINKSLINETKEKIRKLRKEKKCKRSVLRKIKLKNGDLFEQNLKNFDFIYIYSLPTMQRYLTHVFKTAKKGATLISYKYSMNGFDSLLKLSYKLDLEKDPTNTTVYYYKKVI